MTWLDRIENKIFSITTGDGKVWRPLWKTGGGSRDFNAPLYEFINLPGSLVDRRQPRANKYPLTFWFAGENNIDVATDFRNSINDKRAWKVDHPFYGPISGHPVSVGWDDTNFNLTEFTVEFWESITQVVPDTSVSVPDLISGRYTTMATIAPVDYAGKTAIKPADVSTVKDSATQINLLLSKGLDSIHYSEYQVKKNQLFADINNMILSPADAIRSLYDLVQEPAMFSLAVKNRINLLGTVYASLKGIPAGRGTVNNKAYFEAAGASAIAAMALAMVNPQDSDYTTRASIAVVDDQLTGYYNDYLQALDGFYVDMNDPGNAYSASAETQQVLKTMIVETRAQLLTLALNARQERQVVLDRDSNLIVETHKYMGLDADDVNLETFRTINGIRNRKLFKIPKGTMIRYYAA